MLLANILRDNEKDITFYDLVLTVFYDAVLALGESYFHPKFLCTLHRDVIRTEASVLFVFDQ